MKQIAIFVVALMLLTTFSGCSESNVPDASDKPIRADGSRPIGAG